MTWFIYDSYSYAGAPKLEAQVADYAQKEYMNMLIDDSELPKMISKLQAVQNDMWEQNKRLKKVEIRLGSLYSFDDRNLFIYIGSHTLRLRRVIGKLSFEEA